MTNSERINAIKTRLQQQLSPAQLEIIDESALHLGHPGAAKGGHFKIRIAAETFNNKSILTAHRLIYDALADLMNTEIHALSIQIL